jgi:Na+-driven multidrug efflux pump
MLSTVCQAAIRATGDVKTPLVILLGVGVLNTLLDPLLMFGIGPLPALGMQGAAIAGVLSRALGAVVGLWILARRDRLLRSGDWSQLTASWSAVARVAVPVVVQMLSLAMAGMVMMRIAASLGSETLAGIGVGLRVDAIVSAMVLGLPIVLPTFIGQNVGAGNAPRAGQGILVGMRQVLITQAVLAALLFVSARTISFWFSSDPGVQEALSLFLVVVPVGHIGYTLLTTSAGTLIALGHTRSQMVMALAPVLLSITMAWTGARLFGTLGLIAAFPIARVVAGICAWSWVKNELRTAGFLSEAPVNAEPSAI